MKKNSFVKIFVIIINYALISSVGANQVNLNCYGYLTELIRTSNFPFRDIVPSKINLLIDQDENDEIVAQLVYDQLYEIDHNTYTAIGWVKYYMQSQRLYDVSAYIDADDSVALSFNKNYADLFKQCRTSGNESNGWRSELK